MTTRRRRDLSFADLRGGAPGRGRDLCGANLEFADFRGADLAGVNFQSAFLKCADFRGANLEGADFRGSWIVSADFRGANLDGAKFEGAVKSSCGRRCLGLPGQGDYLKQAPCPQCWAVNYGVKDLDGVISGSCYSCDSPMSKKPRRPSQ